MEILHLDELCVFSLIFYLLITSCCHIRDDACKVLVDVYGANIDLRDFSGKKALHHLKGNQQLKHALGVGIRFESNEMYIILKKKLWIQ